MYGTICRRYRGDDRRAMVMLCCPASATWGDLDARCVRNASGGKMKRRAFFAIVVAILVTFQTLMVGSPNALAASQAAGRLVSDDPANFTPHVLDGQVYSVVQVDNTIVVGGTFTQARSNNSNTVLTRNRLMAFDATTGLISTTFNPSSNGTINVVLPAGDGTVYVGGSFTSLAGQAVKNLAKVRVSDGSLVTSFNGGSPAGVVKDLRLAKGKLWVAGGFTHIAGRNQPALATLNPNTGAFDNFFLGAVAGVHKAGSYTTGMKLDVDPQQTRMVVVGNFDTLNGVKNHQLFMLDLSGASAQPADFQTSFYNAGCSSSFDSYMRDVDFAPDGTFFVVSTTGAYGGYGDNAPCDTAARFDTSQTGPGVKPSWVNYSGGDTSYAVEITDTAVYVGGHQRWWNNPYAGDRAGAGAVSRPGIAALNPLNGIPFSWNPTRDRGVGVFDMLSTSQGLWIVSDTERVGAYEYHARVAMFPIAGLAVPSYSTAPFPNDVYSAGRVGAASDPRVLFRVNAGGAELAANKGIDWADDANGSHVNSTPHNASSYSAVGSVDGTVPAGTPSALFSTEAWDSWDAQEMTWSFPVPVGTPVQVRLYFANRYSGTSQVGQRVFDVNIDGAGFLSGFDIVAAAGNNVGTMRSKNVTSDGSVDISFGHVTENPLVNGIEIIRTDVPEGASGGISKRSFNGEVAGASMAIPDGGVDWNTVRGAFMVNGQLYAGFSDGTFSRRSFDGSSVGSAELVDGQDQLVVLQNWRDDISNMSGMFYDSGRMYYTVVGNSSLYYRYINLESGIVGALRNTASANVAGIDFSKVKGMFLGAQKLYWATADGNLHAINWVEGAVAGAPQAGTASVVSGPSVDGASWSNRAMFLYQDDSGDGAGQPPVAQFSINCVGVTCSVDAAGSTAAGATITSYQWAWGDGATSTGVTSSHNFAGRGTFNITLTVTTSKGASSQVTQSVTLNMPPVAAFAVECTLTDCSFDATTSSDDAGIVSYDWDFGDEQSGSGATAQHAYSAAGSYEVRLTLTDSDGASSTLTQTAHAVEQPIADFVVDCTSLACSFDASSSAVPGSEVASYSWDFGDQTSPKSGKKPEHSFASSGTYNVGLTITTAEGLTATTTKAVEVLRVNQKPVADFVKTCNQLECSFDASASSDPDGSIDSYSWNFGGGTTKTGKSVEHTFAAGSHVVTLTVTDNDGASDSKAMDIDVSASSVTFVAAASANANQVNHVVRVPSSAQPGDRLLLFLSLNSNVAATPPSGWTLVRSTDGSSFMGRAWTRVATTSDVGANVTVQLSAYAKGDLTIAAYRSSTGSVGIAEDAAATASAASGITTPTLAVGSGGLAVNYFGVKSSTAVTASLPTGLTERGSSAGSGSGAVYAWVGDSGSYLADGSFGGQSFTLSGSANRILTYGLLLRAQ